MMVLSSAYKVINKAGFRPRLLGFILAGFSTSFRVSNSSVLEFKRTNVHQFFKKNSSACMVLGFRYNMCCTWKLYGAAFLLPVSIIFCSVSQRGFLDPAVR